MKKSIIPILLSLFLITGCQTLGRMAMSETGFFVAVRDGDVESVQFALDCGYDIDKPISGLPPLVNAAEENQREVAAFLIERGADVNAVKEGNGMTALMASVYAYRDYKDTEALVDLLLDSGADIEQLDDEGKSALQWAFDPWEEDSYPLTAKLINAGADLDGWGEELLYTSCEVGAAEIVAALLARGIAVDKKYGSYEYPLIQAAESEHLTIVNLLIDAGADVNAVTEDGYNAMRCAMGNESVLIVEALLEAGADPNQKIDGESILYRAVENENTELVSLLLSSGADIETGTNDETPLSRAVFYEYPEIVKLLIDNGAEVEQKDKNGVTMMGLACERGRHEVVEALIAGGADVNASNYYDDHRPLYYAIRSRDLDTVKSVVLAGAELNYRSADDYGNTPLHQAVDYGEEEIVSLLMAHGANPGIRRSHDDRTPLDIAKRNKLFRIEAILLN